MQFKGWIMLPKEENNLLVTMNMISITYSCFSCMIEEEKKANMIADQPKLTNKRSGGKKHGCGV